MKPYLACVLWAAVCLAAPVHAQPLPALNLAPEATTVSGLSSGGYMAVQMHVVFSKGIMGAAVVAGGPYFCAQGSLLQALSSCMDADDDGPEVAPLLTAAQGFATEGVIDPLAGMAGDRVYLFAGSRDETVVPPVVAAAAEFYRQAGIAETDLTHVTGVPAGHGFLALGGPVPCGETRPPFITDCGVDQAGEILDWLYGPLIDAVSADPARLTLFDQGLYLSDPEGQGMDAQGLVYVPESCASGAQCRLHVAFHGCQQGRATLGDTFAATTGYNGWAEANGIVVLYPQAIASVTDGNPNGCWDWWGYGSDLYHTRAAPQIAAVARMAQALGVSLSGAQPVCVEHDNFNAMHYYEGRAEFCGFSLCAVGSGDRIGGYYGASVLFETGVDQFRADGCGVL